MSSIASSWHLSKESNTYLILPRDSIFFIKIVFSTEIWNLKTLLFKTEELKLQILVNLKAWMLTKIFKNSKHFLSDLLTIELFRYCRIRTTQLSVMYGALAWWLMCYFMKQYLGELLQQTRCWLIRRDLQFNTIWILMYLPKSEFWSRTQLRLTKMTDGMLFKS